MRAGCPDGGRSGRAWRPSARQMSASVESPLHHRRTLAIELMIASWKSESQVHTVPRAGLIRRRLMTAFRCPTSSTANSSTTRNACAGGAERRTWEDKRGRLLNSSAAGSNPDAGASESHFPGQPARLYASRSGPS